MQEGHYELGSERATIEPIIGCTLSGIINALKTKGTKKGLQEFLKAVNENGKFDYALARMLRRMVATYLAANNGVQEGEEEEKNERYHKHDTIGRIVLAVANILKLSLKVVSVDSHCTAHVYCASSKSDTTAAIIPHTSVTICMIPSYCYILYTSMDLAIYPELSSYDKEVMLEMRCGLNEEEDYGIGEHMVSVLIPKPYPTCTFCQQSISQAEELYSHCYECKTHKSCFMEYVKKQTRGMFLLTSRERMKYSQTCPICNKALTNEEILRKVLEGETKLKMEVQLALSNRKEIEHNRIVYSELMNFADKDKVVELPCCYKNARLYEVIEHFDYVVQADRDSGMLINVS